MDRREIYCFPEPPHRRRWKHKKKRPAAKTAERTWPCPLLKQGRGDVVPVSAEKPSGCRVSDLSSPGGFTVTDSRGLSPHSTCRPGGRSLTRYRICPYYTTPGAVCKEAVLDGQGNQFSRIVQISEGFRRQLNIICERGRLEFESALNCLIRLRANFLSMFRFC